MLQIQPAKAVKIPIGLHIEINQYGKANEKSSRIKW